MALCHSPSQIWTRIKIAMHYKRHLKKRTAAIDSLPPEHTVYARENDDSSGRPISTRFS